MTEVKWIKIVTDIFDDEKILLIESMPEADSIIVIWFKLLCLAGKQNNSGVFILNSRMPYTDEMFATVFRRPLNTVRLALKTFEDLCMVEIINDTYTIPKWEKHQKLDALEASREATRQRVSNFREKQKAITGCNVTCNVTEGVTVTPCNADRIDIEEDIEKEIEKESDIEVEVRKHSASRRFTPPSIDEVKSYCLERKNNVDAERFVDFYTANGWTQGKGKPIRDWKACVRTWERSGYNDTNVTHNETKQSIPGTTTIWGDVVI